MIADNADEFYFICDICSNLRDHTTTQMPQIVKTANATKALSREQKAFNTYIKNIKEAKESFAHLKDVNQWLMGKGESIIRPSEEKAIAAHKKLIFALDSSPFVQQLSKKLYEKFEEMMVEGLSIFVHEAEDEELIPLYDKYNNISFAEERAASMGAVNQMVGMMFGIDADFTAEELENPALLQEKMKEIQEKKMAEAEEREANRKKTVKQLEREAKTKEAEKKLTQTSKKIYLELVKNFHPDQEQDEAEREKKTAILQEANAAYANDDFLALLELQIRLFQEKEEALSNTSDETLKYYNKILKDQLAQLKNKLATLDPQRNGHPYGDYYHATQSWRVDKKMKATAKEHEEEVNSYEQQMKRLNTLQSFKEYIQNFELAEEAFEMSDMFDFFRK